MQHKRRFVNDGAALIFDHQPLERSIVGISPDLIGKRVAKRAGSFRPGEFFAVGVLRAIRFDAQIIAWHAAAPVRRG
jgi:hypothetical protein